MCSSDLIMIGSSQDHKHGCTRERDYQLAAAMTRSSWGNYSQHIPEAAMAMKMAPRANPRPGRVPEQEQSDPRNLSAIVAELAPLVDHVERRLNSSARFLDYGGRLTYVNSVLSAIPMHFICSIKVPKTIINLIDRARRHCMWAKDEDSSSDRKSVV